MLRILVGLLPAVSLVSGHARLVEPPSRASMWRYGFDTPPNYNDNEGFCGGFFVQWEVNGGRCGLCGDAWNAEVQEHEAPGGKYATGTIVREYTLGQTIDVSVEVTANHLGSFTFKLCRAPSAEQDPTQECLDQHQLTTSSGEKEWELPSNATGVYDLQVVLPQDYQCSQCVLQWTWKVANGWGICQDGSQGMGCGIQEHFRACSDVRIAGEGEQPSTKEPTTSNTSDPVETTKNIVSTTAEPEEERRSCKAAGEYSGSGEIDEWCTNNCLHPTYPYCPPTHCKCE